MPLTFVLLTLDGKETTPVVAISLFTESSPIRKEKSSKIATRERWWEMADA